MKLLYKIKHFYSYIILYTILIVISAISVVSYNSEYSRNQQKIINSPKDLTFECKVTGYPDEDESQIKFECEIIKGNLKGIKVYVTSDTETAPAGLMYGDILSISAPLSLPTTTGIEGSFDYRNYLKSLDITAVCRTDGANIRIKGSKEGAVRYISGIRTAFMSNTGQYMSPDHAGLVNAVTTGDRRGISDTDADAFKKCGIYHIVAISGLHLSIFICCISYLISRIRLKRIPKAAVSAVICIAAAIFILIFTGFGVSVKRAFVMLVVSSLSGVSSRNYNSKQSLLLAGFIIIIFMPYSLYSTALRLSFLSTLAVLVSADISKYLQDYTTFRYSDKYLFVTSLVSVISAVFTLPVTASDFGYIPLYSCVANAAVLPVMPYFLVLSVIFALSSFWLPSAITDAIATVCSSCAEYILSLARMLADLPSSDVTIYPMRAALILATIVVSLVAIYAVYKRKFKSAVAIISVLCVAISGFLMYNNNSDTIKVAFLDVGQGDCSVIELPDGGCAIIDCGSDYVNDYNYRAVKNYLRTHDIKKADVAFVSHYHKDHAGALAMLVEDGCVERLILPRYFNSYEQEAYELHNKLLAACLKSGTEICYADENDKVSFKCGAVFEVVSPTPLKFTDNNNMSAIISFTYGETSFLFCGDAEAKAMESLEQKIGTYDVIKWPHHGSQNSCAKQFTQITKPKYAVISCAANNVYGHPHQSILDTLDDAGVHYYRTDKQGSVTFEINRTEIKKISTMR